MQFASIFFFLSFGPFLAVLLFNFIIYLWELLGLGLAFRLATEKTKENERNGGK